MPLGEDIETTVGIVIGLLVAAGAVAFGVAFSSGNFAASPLQDADGTIKSAKGQSSKTAALARIEERQRRLQEQAATSRGAALRSASQQPEHAASAAPGRPATPMKSTKVAPTQVDPRAPARVPAAPAPAGT